MTVAAIVLAGGASTRFGGDKLAADLGGRPVLARAVDAVARIASPVVLVLAPGAPVPGWAEPGAPAGSLVIARDPETFGGPLVGLGAGLAALRSLDPATRVAVVVGGDMPALVPDVLALLADAALAAAALAAAAPGAVTLEAEPPAILPAAVAVDPALAAIEAILRGGGRRSLRALLEALDGTTVPAVAWRALDPSAATLRDIDTPADLG